MMMLSMAMVVKIVLFILSCCTRLIKNFSIFRYVVTNITQVPENDVRFINNLFMKRVQYDYFYESEFCHPFIYIRGKSDNFSFLFTPEIQ